jgi:hypothetical protein
MIATSPKAVAMMMSSVARIPVLARAVQRLSSRRHVIELAVSSTLGQCWSSRIISVRESGGSIKCRASGQLLGVILTGATARRRGGGVCSGGQAGGRLQVITGEDR